VINFSMSRGNPCPGIHNEENSMRITASAIVTLVGLSSTAFADTTAGPSPVIMTDVDLESVSASISIDLDYTRREGRTFEADITIDHLRSDGYPESFGVSTACDINTREKTVDCAGFLTADFTIGSRGDGIITIDLRPDTVMAYSAGALPVLLTIFTTEDEEDSDEYGARSGEDCSEPGTRTAPAPERGCESISDSFDFCCDMMCTYVCLASGAADPGTGGVLVSRECEDIDVWNDCGMVPTPGDGSSDDGDDTDDDEDDSPEDEGEVLGDGW
jgi:hypothetical protein